jgi:hypothetical protein
MAHSSSAADSSASAKAIVPTSLPFVTPSVSTNHSFTIKLTPKNFLAWKHQFSPLLNYQGLSHIIDPTAVVPPEMISAPSDSAQQIPNPEYQSWFQKDQMVLSWILSSLTEEVYPYIIGLTSAASTWQALALAFGSVSQNRQLQIHIELQELKRHDLSVAQYLHKAKALADELEAAGRPLSAAEFNAIIYRNIGSEFHSIITALNLRPDPVSFHELFGQLIAHEILIKGSQQLPIANAVNTAPTSLGFSAATGSHRSSSSSSSSMSRPSSSKPKGPCQICGWRNHTAQTCRRRYQPRSASGVPQAAFVPRSVSGNPQANFVQTQPSFPSAASSSVPQMPWYLDSAANAHITPDFTHLQASAPYQGTDQLLVGNGQGLPITHTGTSVLPTATGSLMLKHALCVPSITKNLLSVQKCAADNNVYFEFWPSYFLIKDQVTNQVLLKGPSENGVYALPVKQAMVATVPSFDDWHARLGHPNSRLLAKVLSQSNLPSSSSKLSPCSSCCLGKLSRVPLVSVEHRSSTPFEIVYSDVWGPAPVLSTLGYRYMLLFVDDFTRFSWIYLIKQKTDVYPMFLQFQQLIQRQFNTSIKAFHSDWGGEYQKLNSYFKSVGIVHRIACPYTHEQNGIAERKIRHLVDTGLTLLSHASLPLKFWGYAFEVAVSLLNNLPTTALKNASPFLKLFRHPPSLMDIKPFGCAIFPFLRPYNKHKFAFRSAPCVYLGCSPSHSAFRCLDVSSNRVYLARHATFHEHVFPYQTLLQTSQQSPSLLPPSPPWLTVTHHTTSPSAPAQTSGISSSLSASPSSNPTPSASSPTSPPSRTHPMVLRPRTMSRREAHVVSRQKDFLQLEPHTFHQAVSYNVWKEAMHSEFTALLANKTWSLVPRSSAQNVIGNKWVFRIKRKSDGSIERYKARLVAKGYAQESGVDYSETFSPVVKMTTVRTVLALATMHGWPLRQFDISNAFLHGYLDHDIFMEQPQGFVDSAYPDYVCKLHKSLYGLKQAPRAWFTRLSAFLHGLGFHTSKADHSLFILNKDGVKLFILIYVDDILVTCSDERRLDWFFARLQAAFPVRDLGPLHYFLGIEVHPTQGGLVLTQRRYIGDILLRHGLADSKPCATPMASTPPLSRSSGTPYDNPQLYRQVLGALQYVTLTRPDVAFSVNKLSQFMHCPTTEHWTAVKRLLRYLNGTRHLGLFFSCHSKFHLHFFSDGALDGPHLGGSQLHLFSDSDWGGDPDDRRSTGGYAVYLGSNLISWQSKKQPTIARSSTESEYKAVANATAEMMWLRSLLFELGFPLSQPADLWCDNVGAIYLTANPVFHARTKHIELDYHFVREQVQLNRLRVRHISGDDQLADILTKPLPHRSFLSHRDKLRLVLLPASA